MANEHILSQAANGDLMTTVYDNLDDVCGKILKCIQDNEEVCAAAFVKLRNVLGTECVDYAMPDLTRTNYIKTVMTFVDALIKLDAKLKEAEDRIKNLEAKHP